MDNKQEIKTENKLQVKKMKQGMSYSCKEKTIILNVFKYFRFFHPEVCVTELVRRTARATGCSEKSIFQFRKEETSATGFKEPSKTKIRKNININSRDNKYGLQIRQAIRNIIYDLKYRNIIPSLNTILKHVNGDPSLPTFSLMTLRRLLFDMGFCYEKNGNKSVLVDKLAVKEEKEKGGKSKGSNGNGQGSRNRLQNGMQEGIVQSGLLNGSQNNLLSQSNLMNAQNAMLNAQTNMLSAQNNLQTNGQGMQNIMQSNTQNNGLQNNGLQNNGVQNNGVQNNSVQNNGMQNNSIQNNNIQSSSIQNNSMQNNSMQNNGIQNNGIQNNGIRNNGIQNNSVQNNGVQNNGMQNTGIQSSNTQSNNNMDNQQSNAPMGPSQILSERLEMINQMPQMILQNMPQLNSQGIVPGHVSIMSDQNHRILQMHMGHPDQQLMPTMHPHNMPLMIDHRRDLMTGGPPPTIVQNIVPPWMHSNPHNMVKQQ